MRIYTLRVSACNLFQISSPNKQIREWQLCTDCPMAKWGQSSGQDSQGSWGTKSLQWRSDCRRGRRPLPDLRRSQTQAFQPWHDDVQHASTMFKIFIKLEKKTWITWQVSPGRRLATRSSSSGNSGIKSDTCSNQGWRECQQFVHHDDESWWKCS